MPHMERGNYRTQACFSSIQHENLALYMFVADSLSKWTELDQFMVVEDDSGVKSTKRNSLWVA